MCQWTSHNDVIYHDKIDDRKLWIVGQRDFASRQGGKCCECQDQRNSCSTWLSFLQSTPTGRKTKMTGLRALRGLGGTFLFLFWMTNYSLLLSLFPVFIPYQQEWIWYNPCGHMIHILPMILHCCFGHRDFLQKYEPFKKCLLLSFGADSSRHAYETERWESWELF